MEENNLEKEYQVCDFCGEKSEYAVEGNLYDKQCIICPSCLKKETYKVKETITSEIAMYKAELMIIIVGMIVGLVLAIIFSVAVGNKIDIWVFKILIPIWIIFSCGTIISSVKRIKSEHKSGDWVGTLMNIIVSIVFSPAATTKRIIYLCKQIKTSKNSYAKAQAAIDELTEKGF